jgi:MFS family permease
LLTIAVIGLWAAAVYEPTALIQLSLKAGMAKPAAIHMASIGTGILSIGTILGCITLPAIAERIGRRRTLAIYFMIMLVMIVASFGWAFYLPSGTALPVFLVTFFFLGLAALILRCSACGCLSFFQQKSARRPLLSARLLAGLSAQVLILRWLQRWRMRELWVCRWHVRRLHLPWDF